MAEQHCIFIFHGSASKPAKEAALKLASNLKCELHCSFSICYLKEGAPSLSSALNSAYSDGFREIKCMPLLLLPGSHTLKEVPEIISEFKNQHPDCEITQLPCLAESSHFVEFVIKTLDTSNV